MNLDDEAKALYDSDTFGGLKDCYREVARRRGWKMMGYTILPEHSLDAESVWDNGAGNLYVLKVLANPRSRYVPPVEFVPHSGAYVEVAPYDIGERVRKFVEQLESGVLDEIEFPGLTIDRADFDYGMIENFYWEHDNMDSNYFDNEQVQDDLTTFIRAAFTAPGVIINHSYGAYLEIKRV